MLSFIEKLSNVEITVYRFSKIGIFDIVDHLPNQSHEFIDITYQVGDFFHINSMAVKLNSGHLESLIFHSLRKEFAQCSSLVEFYQLTDSLISRDAKVVFKPSQFKLYEENMNWHALMPGAFADSEREYRDVKQIDFETAKKLFAEKSSWSIDNLNKKVNEYLREQVEEFISSDVYVILEQKFLEQKFRTGSDSEKTPSTNKPELEEHDASLFLELNQMSLSQRNSTINDLFDFLKETGYLLEEVTKFQFNSLFNPDATNPANLNWQGSIKTLGLFAKYLPITNENPLVAVASRFYQKGNKINNRQLLNNGRNAVTEGEKRLVTFLQNL
tara:strand:- start:61958 stop:62944 length:987 start_codon:yes stop_codon:yes gene_type:complete